MGQVPTESEMLAAARPLVAAGAALHWLRRREKAPFNDDWTTLPVHTLETLQAAYRSGANIGIRLGEPSKTAAGYIHLIDLDIRSDEHAEAAWAALLALWPAARSAPFVISGSGGESRHLYFVTDKPFRSRKIRKSDGFSMVWDAKKGREVKKNDWEIEVFGTSKQAVLPPSLHPDTGEAYTWGRPLDWDLLELGVAPFVPSETVEAWGLAADNLDIGEDDDLMGLVRSQPMGLSEDEIARTIADLPPEWPDDRDLWLQVGAALHHEYEGSAAGFERWCEWSKLSAKYDAPDQARVWKSFRGARNPVRMATLIKAAGEYRLTSAHADLDDLSDLLGGVEADADEARSPGSRALAVVPVADDLADLLGPTEPKPIAPGARVLPPVDPEWRSYLQMTEEGGIKATLHNVELIIRNDKRTRGVAGFNRFSQEITQIGRPGVFKLRRESPKPTRQLDSPVWKLRDPVNGDLWSDSHDVDVRVMLEAPTRQGGYELKTSDRDLRGAIDKAAHLNAFHPVQDYLNGLEWDGVNRVANLFVDYLGATDDDYHREAALLFCLGAVTRVFEPGHKFDFVPILEGLQGKRKSTFVAILARHWSSELEGDFHDSKTMVEKMQGAWICEIPELQGFSKADVTTIKGFISRTKDKVRLAYAKRAAEYLRQCIFMGSTNDIEYLRDGTGGRRFWPIACHAVEIDTDRLQLNIDQIWAEAKALYDEWRRQQPHGTLPLYMKNAAAAAQAREIQESRRQESVEETLAGQMEAWLDQPINADLGLDDLDGEPPRYRNEVCLLEVWCEMMGRDRSAYDSRAQQALGRAVRLLGDWQFTRRDLTAKYGRQRIFRRKTPI